MNNFLLFITNKFNLLKLIIAILFVLFFASVIAYMDYSKVVEVNTSKLNLALSPENENKILKEILSSILPSENDILFENEDREINSTEEINSTPKSPTAISPTEIMRKGKGLAYIFAYTDEEYLRPIYSSTWKQAYYQGWLYLPKKIISARHKLFTYVGGAGRIFDMEGELGFYPNTTIDNQNYINFLIYNFDPNNIIQLGNEIVIAGTPTKKGVHIISVKIDDISVHTNETESICVHLCTPSGNEIDYQNVQLSKTLDEGEDYGPVDDSFSESSSQGDIVKQNLLLKRELTNYISDSTKPIYFQYNGGYQISNALHINIDLDEALKACSKVEHTVLYNKQDYKSPIFHPKWKELSDKEWCYIPRKLYINMKKLFVLPSDKEVSYDLLGELGFFEELPDFHEDQTALLVKNFTVSAVCLYQNNVLLQGKPIRDGIQIIGIPKTNLTKHKEYSVRLVTNDHCELDIDVIKN